MKSHLECDRGDSKPGGDDIENAIEKNEDDLTPKIRTVPLCFPGTPIPQDLQNR